MLDREERASLVVPYTPPSPPRVHLALAAVTGLLGALAGLMLLVADYSADVTAVLVVGTVGAIMLTVGLVAAGVVARRRFRDEMERAVDVTPMAAPTDPSRRAG